MKWATRARVCVDRAACAWLIRRFVDPDAEFLFVNDPAEVPADATAFDMRGVEHVPGVPEKREAVRELAAHNLRIRIEMLIRSPSPRRPACVPAAVEG